MTAFVDSLMLVAQGAFVELALFAAVGFIIGGVDELIIDGLYVLRAAWRRLTVYRRHARTYASDLARPGKDFALAVFVPAWDESSVIAKMIRHAIRSYGEADITVFVGCYPNDTATIAAVRPLESDRVRIVVGARDGGTTKADCLNTLWRELEDVHRAGQGRFTAVVLHDAEDMVSPYEARVIAHLISRFGLIQLPVVPLVDGAGRWVSGHYCDEFAESHGKTLIVREAIGASLPLAGVGCAIRTDILEGLARNRGGRPFDDASLTEDYETGLSLGAAGCETAFVRMLDRPGGELVATRAHFPATLDAAVRQKSRWIIGIAIAGWDRIGWGRGFAENWMRLRDRQGLIAALVLCAGYLALFLWLALAAFHVMGGPPLYAPPLLTALIEITWLLLIWRLLMRAFFVGRVYGVGEALRSVPRAVLANMITILAARRASSRYLIMLRRREVVWDKTAHRFPDVAT